jgi:hypothetical protein
MSITYTPTTNFGSKDSLPSNDPNKVIKGTEFTTEFIAIQTAFGLAAPTSNPTFTGTATFDDISANTISLTDVDVVTLDVTGTATLADADVVTLDVTGTSTLADADVVTLDVTGTSTLADADVTTLDVTGTSTLADADVTTLDVTGTLTASSLLYPTTDGTDGQALLTDGSGTLAFGDVVGGIDYTKETSNYTLEANQGVIADTTGGTFVVTLPLSPAEGDQVVVADGGDWATTNLTVGRNGQTIEGVASDLTMDVGGISVTMVFDGTTWQLYPATGTSSGTSYTLDQTTTAGNVTTNDITVGGLTAGDTTVGNLTSTGIDDNATSTAITIDASENVGIGRQNPSAPLDVAMVSGDYTKRIQTTYPNGSSGQPSFGWKFLWGGNAISPEIGLLHGGSYTDAGLYFDTVNAGAKVSAMRIDADGNLLVGKTEAVRGGEIGHWLEPNGESVHTITSATNTLHVYNIDAGVLRFYVGQQGTIYATSTSISGLSDASLKENIRDLDKGLDAVLALQPRRFDWKNGDGNDVMGFIAQEVEEVMPELIGESQYNKDEVKKNLKMGDMLPSLVKAIQEQQAMIETLQAEVAALKGVN